MPVVVTTDAFGLSVQKQKTVEVPELQFVQFLESC